MKVNSWNESKVDRPTEINIFDRIGNIPIGSYYLEYPKWS